MRKCNLWIVSVWVGQKCHAKKMEQRNAPVDSSTPEL